MILELCVAAQVLTDQRTDARSSVRESHHPKTILPYISGKQLNMIISVLKKIYTYIITAVHARAKKKVVTM
jgi:hypothetical protein